MPYTYTYIYIRHIHSYGILFLKKMINMFYHKNNSKIKIQKKKIFFGHYN